MGHLHIGEMSYECDALLKTRNVLARAEYLRALSYIPLHRQRDGLFRHTAIDARKSNPCLNAYF